jgi:hypothetical protein
MAVIGISRSETFEYVLDSDPCKRRVELEVPRIEDAAADHTAADHRHPSIRFHPDTLPSRRGCRPLIASAHHADSLVSDPIVLLFTARSG